MFQPENLVGQDMPAPAMAEPTLNDLYQPETGATQQFNSILNQYPTREKPTLMRKIGAALMNIGGQDGMAFLDEPNRIKIEDWKNKINPALQAANLERYSNANERQLATSILNNRVANRKVDVTERQGDVKLTQGQEKIDLDKKRVELLTNAQKFKENHPDWEIKAVPGGNYTFFNPQNPNDKPIDSGIKSGELGDTELANLNQKNALARIEAQGNNSLDVANASGRGWQFVNVPDPNDPTKVISGWANPDNPSEFKPLKVGGQNVEATKPTVEKPDVTAQTRAMMEGAQMLRPHVTDLRRQAAELDRRGLFGPVMSRLRNLAAKVGTTGSPEEIEKNLNSLSNTITSDPLLNQSNDAAVGEFLTNLGLMTSGMGRVHGGARGGGSIQMLNYLKSILGSDSSLSMFNGRVNTLDDYLKGYAAGPASDKKDKLDSALDKIFGAR